MIKTVNFTYDREEDLQKAKSDLGDYKPDQLLIQVFTCHTDIEKIKVIRASLLEAFPLARLIGASTAGEIFEGATVENATVVSLMKFESTKVKTIYIDDFDSSSAVQVSKGKEAGKLLGADDLKASIILSYSISPNILAANVLEFLSTYKALTPNAIFAGGLAGVYEFNHKLLSVTFTEKSISNFGIAIAGLYGEELVAFNKLNLSWVPIGKKLSIQEVHGKRLKMIDNMTACELYRTYLGEDVIEGLPVSAAEFPLILERSGKQMIVQPVRIYADGSIEMSHILHVGEQLRFSYCHVGLLALSAYKIYNELLEYNLQTNFIYSCAIRQNVLGEDIVVELDPMAQLSPSVGFFAYGEFYDEGVNEYHRIGQTTTILGLREGGYKEAPKKAIELYKDYSYQERSQFRTMRVLHRLIEKSTRDLEMSLVNLAQLANKDALTGLYNRGYFDEQLLKELKRHTRTKMPLSLILLDIDYFKNYNDTYGHVSGDDALRGVGHCLSHQAGRPDDIVTRYGGEEMAIILPNTDQEGAIFVAEKIRKGIMDLEIPHASSHVAKVLTVSIGVITLYDLSEESLPDIASVVDACDRYLYEAKESGRNKVVGGVFQMPLQKNE